MGKISQGRPRKIWLNIVEDIEKIEVQVWKEIIQYGDKWRDCFGGNLIKYKSKLK